MKAFFLVLNCLAASSLCAQNDTIITYLNEWYQDCDRVDATRYTMLYKEGNNWKKSTFNIKNQKVETVAFYRDKDCKIAEGLFTSYYTTGELMMQGSYVDNKKTGVWKGWSKDNRLMDSINYKDGFIQGIGLKWHLDSPVIDSLIFEEGGNGIEKSFWPNGQKKQQGSYASGKKEGPWTYYYKTGVTCQEVIYKADSATSFTCYDPGGNPDTKNCVYEKEAAFEGGDKAWIKYLVQRLNAIDLPKAYKQGKIWGTVFVQFVVDIDGALTDIKLVNSVHPELDAIALRVIRESPKWIPAVQYNRKVKAYRKQPISFSRTVE